MRGQADVNFDVASAMIQGSRDVQEDALASDFQVGSDFGFAVLSDGMGGHEAGDVASNIVVTEVFSELKLQSGNSRISADSISGILSGAAASANECIREHSAANPETYGMGATLIAPVLMQDRLFWISIGDSPLFLYRGGKLSQLNEDHSLAPQIDYMVKSGVISESAGRDHPDRNCLTSALLGDHIPQIDCPQEPFMLTPGDVIIAASDGLQFLTNSQIQRVLASKPGAASAEIAEMLLSELKKVDDPYQDNVCFTVIRVRNHPRSQPRRGKGKAKKKARAPVLASANGAAAPQASARIAVKGRAFLSRLMTLSTCFLR